MNPLSIVIIVFVFILIIMLFRYIYVNPYLLQGLQNGETHTSIPTSKLAQPSSGVPSSNFAYSIWMQITDWNYRYGMPKVIFGRMGALSDVSGGDISGINGADPCPLVVLGAIENDLTIAVGCFPGEDESSTSTNSTSSSTLSKTKKTVVHTCKVSNIPIQTWVNLTISVYGRTLDVYIDGKLVKTCLLPGIVSVNNNAAVQVTPNGGFEGYTSNLQYFPNSINPQEAWDIYVKGPGTGMGTYQLQLSVIQNGTTQGSVTI